MFQSLLLLQVLCPVHSRDPVAVVSCRYSLYRLAGVQRLVQSCLTQICRDYQSRLPLWSLWPRCTFIALGEGMPSQWLPSACFLGWDVWCLECSLKTSQDQYLRVQAPRGQFDDYMSTKGPLAVTLELSLAVYCSVIHIPLSTMGGYWHSWGVYFQDRAFVNNTDSIVNANIKNAHRVFHLWDSAVMAIVFFIIVLLPIVVLSVVLSAVLSACGLDAQSLPMIWYRNAVDILLPSYQPALLPRTPVIMVRSTSPQEQVTSTRVIEGPMSRPRKVAPHLHLRARLTSSVG